MVTVLDFFKNAEKYPVTQDTLAQVRQASKSRNGLNVAVFCSEGSMPGTPYEEHAEALGKLIGERGHNIVWGGHYSGLMDTVSRAAHSAGAILIGVNYGADLQGADYVFGATSLTQRKKAMNYLSDISIVLPG